jgi:hypothetical protein
VLKVCTFEVQGPWDEEQTQRHLVLRCSFSECWLLSASLIYKVERDSLNVQFIKAQGKMMLHDGGARQAVKIRVIQHFIYIDPR